MYSYEDRIRAVKLFVKLGKRTGATIRQLGYPTKNSLKSWHLQYERRLDLPARLRALEAKVFAVSRSTWAVDHYLTHGRCICRNTEGAGLSGTRDRFATWLRELHPEIKPPPCWQIAGVSAPELKKTAVSRCALAKEVRRRLLRSLA